MRRLIEVATLKRIESAPAMLENISRGGRPPGSLRALSAEEERRAQLICGKCPDQRSLPFALWTRVAIQELIRRESDIRLSIRGVGEYLARWGYTAQKAARRAGNFCGSLIWRYDACPFGAGGIMAKAKKKQLLAWSKDDIKNLRAFAKAKLSGTQIARKLRRTPGSVSQKAMRLGVRFRSVRRKAA